MDFWEEVGHYKESMEPHNANAIFYILLINSMPLKEDSRVMYHGVLSEILDRLRRLEKLEGQATALYKGQAGPL